MANKNIDGIVYYRAKNHPEGICPYCNRPTLRKTSSVYLIGSRDSNDYICGYCVADRKMKSSVANNKEIVYCTVPKKNPIYLGKFQFHQCEGQSPEYRQVNLVLKKNGKRVDVPARQCTTCDKFFVKVKIYDRDPAPFHGYDIIEIYDDGEHINWTEEARKKREKLPGEVASHLQGYAFKPYQGGRFSGK